MEKDLINLMNLIIFKNTFKHHILCAFGNAIYVERTFLPRGHKLSFIPWSYMNIYAHFLPANLPPSKRLALTLGYLHVLGINSTVAMTSYFKENQMNSLLMDQCNVILFDT